MAYSDIGENEQITISLSAQQDPPDPPGLTLGATFTASEISAGRDKTLDELSVIRGFVSLFKHRLQPETEDIGGNFPSGLISSHSDAKSFLCPDLSLLQWRLAEFEHGG